MPPSDRSEPITFEPIFFERMWGGQKLASLYGKSIPAGRPIGESWEIVDRPEAQSTVSTGTLKGRSLHDLWVNFRREIFGHVPDTARFPLLIKLLDCREKLSLQVHPPPDAAVELRGEPKTECWYIVDALPEAELYLGFREALDARLFRNALYSGVAAEFIHRLQVKTGETFLIPSGRIHAIGSGNVILEVQQNSDTTFRVYDWDRREENGKARKLHVEEALRCINFNDPQPEPLLADRETLLSHELFALDRWQVQSSREITAVGTFAIVFCLQGSICCGSGQFRAGEFFLLPAASENRTVEAADKNSSLLRITVPSHT